MYVSNNLGSYGGLEGAWGETEAKAPAKAEAKALAKAKAEAKAEAAKAPAIKELEEEVEKLAKELAPKVKLANPEDYIPKPKEILGANEAMGILKRPAGVRGGQSRRIEGKVYWSAGGPRFAQKKFTGGKTAESVPPPVIKLHPNVRVVRDMPTLKTLAPVETTAPAPTPKATPLQGFGETKALNWVSIVVLGFVFLALFGYNKP